VDEDAREAAEIVVTELVTNAVEHAASASVVEVERRSRTFRLTVRDFDVAPLPAAHLPDPTSPRGRGLAMVAAVAASWGVEPHRDGKTVWAELTTAS
jgi:two-component sensor histidine kinase